MSANELAAKIKSLSPQQRRIIESLIDSLMTSAPAVGQPDLTDHPAFGAWGQRPDLSADSDAAARDLRRRAAQREPA